MTDTAGHKAVWLANVVALLYFVWNYLFLARQTAAFRGLFEGLGAEIPAPTAFVLAHHRWLYPVVFLGAGIAVLVKEFWITDKRLSAGITFVIALGILWTSDYFKTVLFYPLLGLIEKLAA
jgi:hypothetical protein